MSKRPALGRGLASLIPTASEAPSFERQETNSGLEQVQLLTLDSVFAGSFQPRKTFDDAALSDLSESIREKGILQPILVRKNGDGYELIAGERRLRAARLAGLERIPALVREIADRDGLELALVENIQRENLNAVELAQAFKQLQDDFGYTQEQVSQRVGRDRTTITNHLRLLRLTPAVLELLATDALSMGHARALLGLEDAQAQQAAAEQVVARGLSVRETEQLVNRMKKPKSEPAPPAPVRPEMRYVMDKLKRAFQTQVDIVERKGGQGEIRIEFSSQDELNRILDLLPALET